jgi:chromate transporter
MTATFTSTDWLTLLTHFMSLSLMSIGGAITTAPEMHHYLAQDKGWLTDGQFNASIALAQVAPGPNVLFVALAGWHVGLNAAGGLGAGTQAWPMAAMGAAIAMLGIMLPSTTLTFVAARWARANRQLRAVRAFKQGMAPVVIALLLATGWIMASSQAALDHHLRLWLVSGLSALLLWRTKIHILWLLGAGALLGALGWV